MNSSWKIACALSAATLAALYTAACSAGGGANAPTPLPEHTGAASFKLTSIPIDVQCVEIDTSDYRTSFVRTNVTPGASATITVAPLDTGTVWMWGQAYSQPCDNLYGFDGGVAPVTWVADSTPITIVAGAETDAVLDFHQLGGADVTVNFDNCSDDAGSFNNCPSDAGPPWPWPTDASVLPDGGFMPHR